MRWPPSSVTTGAQLWKYCRSQFDRIRDIGVVSWGQFAESLDPSKIVDTPCRRCGEIVRVPIPSDALRGGPSVPRKRNTHVYNAPMFSTNPNPTDKSTTSVPREDRTGAIEERIYLKPSMPS